MSRRKPQLGYTLVELMVVVIMVGVLATLAVFAVRKYIFAAKTGEAIQMIGAIKAAQEAYRDETFTFLDVTSDLSSYYPAASPGKFKTQWGGNGEGAANWRTLGVTTNNPVQFGYACIAGTGTEAPPQPGDLATNLPFPNPPGEPWYIVKAVADQDEDGTLSVYVGSSFSAAIHSEREGE